MFWLSSLKPRTIWRTFSYTWEIANDGAKSLLVLADVMSWWVASICPINSRGFAPGWCQRFEQGEGVIGENDGLGRGNINKKGR
jgi:hypothetical protein